MCAECALRDILGDNITIKYKIKYKKLHQQDDKDKMLSCCVFINMCAYIYTFSYIYIYIYILYTNIHTYIHIHACMHLNNIHA